MHYEVVAAVRGAAPAPCEGSLWHRWHLQDEHTYSLGYALVACAQSRRGRRGFTKCRPKQAEGKSSEPHRMLECWLG